MAARLLQIIPEYSGYGLNFNSAAPGVVLAGAATGYRPGVVEKTAIAKLNFNVMYDDYNYLTAFYRTATKKGSLPFLVDLLIKNNELSRHMAKMVPRSFKISNVEGILHRISFDVYVDLNAIT